MREILSAVLSVCLVMLPQGTGGKAGMGGTAGIGGGSTATPSPLQQTAWGCVGSFSTTSTCTATSGVNAVSGDPIVVYEQYVQSTGTVGAPTGCATWTLVSNNTASGQAFYIGTVTSSASCVVSMTSTYSSANQSVYIVAEAKQAVAIATVDTETFSGSTLFGCTTCTLPSITTNFASDVVIAFLAGYSTSATVTGTFTLDNSSLPSTATGALTAYKVPAASTINLAFTSSGASNGPGATIALKP